MRRYLLDTNHISDAIKPVSIVRERIDRSADRGLRLGTCVPVLCELEAGLQTSTHQEDRRRSLRRLMRIVRIWPLDPEIAEVFGELSLTAKTSGKVLSQVDLMLAALARIEKLTILTADKDFAAFPDITTENWLA
jgi:predicted nucleic acid-binding protein